MALCLRVQFFWPTLYNTHILEVKEHKKLQLYFQKHGIKKNSVSIGNVEKLRKIEKATTTSKAT